MSTKNQTRVITGEVRLSYANLFEAKSIQGSKPKYSVSLIIPKSDKATLAKIEAAIDAAIEAGTAKFGGKRPNKAALKLPLRDGDTERDDEAYANSMFVNANSTTPPQVVDESLAPILDRSQVYSGCYARASITFYAFNTNGNKGSPADWEMSKRLGTVNRSVADTSALRKTSRRFLLLTKTSLTSR